MEKLLFCLNHPTKIAKRHCNKCDQNLCNECVFESHIEHHLEINKIQYSIDTNQTNYSTVLTREIKSIIDKSLQDLKGQIYHLVLNKTLEYIKEHKNLQLKLNQTTIKHKNSEPPKQQGINITKSVNISEKAKIFNANKIREIPKNIDANNPYHKKEKSGNIKNLAKMFE